MNEQQILFKGAMVRAILAGKKTQTRRGCHPSDPQCVAFTIYIRKPQNPAHEESKIEY